MSNRNLEGAADGTTRAPTRSYARWPWLIVAVGLAVLHAVQLSVLVHHTWGVMVLLALTAVTSLLRGRLVATALLGAPAVALAVDPSSVVVGVGIGFGTLAVLITLFVAIGTLLRLTEGRGQIPARALPLAR